MAIDKSFIVYETKSKFSSDLGNNLIPTKSVVFVKDTGEIYSHGSYFGGDISGGNSDYKSILLNGVSSNISIYGHKHSYTDLTGSTTTANQAIVSNGTVNGWTLKTLGSGAFDSTSYLPLSGGTLTGVLQLSNSGLKFADNAFGGGGDTAKMYLATKGGEDTTMTFEVTNDSNDTINFITPSSTGLTHNGNIILDSLNYSNYALPLTGGTLTGVIKSAFTSNTWINGVTNACLTGKYTGYGAIFNAPVKDGRISLSTYPANDNFLYFGFATTAQITAGTNAFNSQIVFDMANSAINATTFNGTLNGNAASATKVNNALSWSGYSSGSFNGSAAASISIPTKLSQLTNDSGYWLGSSVLPGKQSGVADLSFGSVPTGVSYYNHYSGSSLGSYRAVLTAKDGNTGVQFSTYWCTNNGDAPTGSIYYRVKRDAAPDWSNYRNILDAGNYSSYALPLHGTADTATLLGNFYSSRPTSADITPTGSGGVISFKATSSMTTGKPAIDGHILHFYWDNTGGYDCQMAILNSVDGLSTVQTRGQNAGTWQSWKTLAFTDGNVATATVASKLGKNGNSGIPMTFNWSGQTGQPSWLWGGNDGTNMYVYNPSNFNVNSAVKLATARTIWGNSFDGTRDITGILYVGTLQIGAIDGCTIYNPTNGTYCIEGSNTDVWSDGTNSHPWYGIDHRHRNTGVYSTTITDYFGLSLKTGSGLISLTNGGNVGIGTTSPAYKLDVNGTGRFQGDLVIGNTTIHASGSNGGINSIQPSDDYIIGDCSIGGTMGLKSLNTASAGIGFYGQDSTNFGTLTASGSGLTWTGAIKATGGFVGNLTGTATAADALTANAGNGNQPVYFSGGKPVGCNYAFGNGSGNIPISNGTVNTNLNANLLNGYTTSSGIDNPYGTIPVVDSSDGIFNIGNQLYFHESGSQTVNSYISSMGGNFLIQADIYSIAGNLGSKSLPWGTLYTNYIVTTGLKFFGWWHTDRTQMLKAADPAVTTGTPLSIVHNSTGNFTVTHNIGNPYYTVVITEETSNNDYNTIQVRDKTATSFSLNIRETGGHWIDSGFEFAVFA